MDPRQQAALRNLRSSAISSVQADFVAGLQAAVKAGAVQSRQLQTLAQALAADAIPRERRVAAFEQMGRNAQVSVRQAFTHRRNRRRPNTPGYRNRTTRNANGALLRAINSPQFYQATPNGLLFINRRVLDREANHWRRLNYGAGARAGERPRRFRFEMLAQASFGLAPDPRPAFRMPPGVFLNGGGQAVRFSRERRGSEGFFPRRGGGPATFNTQGIQATNFLDAGIRRIANDLGPTMFGMYRQFYNDAKGRTKFEKTVNVQAPRPRAPRFGTQR